MKIIVIFFLLFCSLCTFAYGLSLEQKYPSYKYVFSEFEVDFSYMQNDEFRTFIKKHEKGLKDFYNHSLKKGKKILPKIQRLLIKEGLSDLFTYQSMIESGFSPSISSAKKAVGLWQFMPATAKAYQLKISKKYDERCQTKESTLAAISYLKKLHKDFGKWYLAMMAYNCGEGRLGRSIKRAKSKDIEPLTSHKLKYLPRETREYIQKILLIAMIGENSILNFDTPKEEYVSTIEVEITQGTTLQEIAKILEVETTLLEKLNQKREKGKIFIPSDKVYDFYLRYNYEQNIIQEEELDRFMIMHIVKLGDTLELISKKYQTQKEKIKSINALKDDFLILHTPLIIPVDADFFKKFSLKGE